MSLKSFNKKDSEQFLNTVYDRINKKFDTDRGKAITDYLIQISEPYLYDFNVEYLLRNLILKDLEGFCENQKITAIQEFERVIINFTKLFCIKMNDIDEPLF